MIPLDSGAPCYTTPGPFHDAEAALDELYSGGGPAGRIRDREAAHLTAPARHLCHTCPVLDACARTIPAPTGREGYTGVWAGRVLVHGRRIDTDRSAA